MLKLLRCVCACTQAGVHSVASVTRELQDGKKCTSVWVGGTGCSPSSGHAGVASAEGETRSPALGPFLALGICFVFTSSFLSRSRVQLFPKVSKPDQLPGKSQLSCAGGLAGLDSSISTLHPPVVGLPPSFAATEGQVIPKCVDACVYMYTHARASPALPSPHGLLPFSFQALKVQIPQPPLSTLGRSVGAGGWDGLGLRL